MKSIFTSIFCCFCFFIYAQPGAPDPTFGTGGKVFTQIGNGSSASAIAVQKNGKVVLAGVAHTGLTYENAYVGLTRYNTNGTLDSTFGLDGKATTFMGRNGSSTRDVALQDDGKILVLANTYVNLSYYLVLFRFNSDGSLDLTFGAGGKVTPTAAYSKQSGVAVAVQKDGKILITGGDGNILIMMRLLPDGTRDKIFGVDGIVSYASQSSLYPTAMSIQNDGKIVLSGGAYIGNNDVFAVARFNSNGLLDFSFNGNFRALTEVGIFGSSCRDVAIQEDGKIVSAGYRYDMNRNVEFVVVRYNSNGTIDLTFDNDGIATTSFGSGSDFGSEVALQDDGKILMAGYTLTPESNIFIAIARFNNNGSLDAGFGNNGKVVDQGVRYTAPNAITLYSNRIYVAGRGQSLLTWNENFVVEAYQNDGLPAGCFHDSVPPVITPKVAVLNLDASGHATLSPSAVIESVIDNCTVDNTSFTVSPNTFSCADRPSTGSSRQSYTSNTSTGNQNFNGELGMDFRVNAGAGIVIRQLGAFDHQGNGIIGQQSGGIRVAVFNKLTRTIVPGLDAIIAGNADAFNSNYRLKNISPVTLLPGEYVLVAKGYNQNELNGNVTINGAPYPAGDAGNGLISFLSTTYYGENLTAGFSYPRYSANLATTNAFLAGTFTYETTATANRQAYVSNTPLGNQNFVGAIGMSFKVNDPLGITVNQLGAFDHEGNGITGLQNGGVRVAIFNKATQAIVPGLDAVITGNGDFTLDNYRFKSIFPVLLLPGEYILLAKGYNDKELNGNFLLNGSSYPVGDSGLGAISFLNKTYWGHNVAGDFLYPEFSADFGVSSAFLAGTFLYSTAGARIVRITAKDISGNVSTAFARVFVQNSVNACGQSIATPAFPTINTLSIPEKLPGKAAIQLYPNPTRDVFSLRLNNMKPGKVNIQVLNQTGTLIEQRTIHHDSKTVQSNLQFNLNKHSSGVYLVKVISADGVQVEKVVVQR